ncbi:MAG: hypothetical protein HOL92_07360 [Opitutales bacterium]|jgi:hypothetical protein|nr:hypothetical protein [Opitutales bacterium]
MELGMTAKKRNLGEGLMAFYSDIDEAYIPRYRQWHNLEHMPERVSIPGFIEGRRYLGAEGAPGFLMMYETEAVDVLESQAYLGSLDDPTPWTSEALAHFRKPLRGIYRLLSSCGESDFFKATWLLTIRLDSDVEITVEQAEAILEDLQGEGIGSVRFYEINDHIAQIKTAEKAIYGENNSYKRYLIFIENSYSAGRKAIVEDRHEGAFSELLKRDGKALVDEYSIEYYLRSPDE